MEMNLVKRELSPDHTYPNLIDTPSLENEQITIKNEVVEEINEGTNVNIKLEAWPCEYIENMENCKKHLEQILSSEIQIKEETPEEYATPLKVTLTEIRKEIDKANHQEPSDLTPAKLHVFQCSECSYRTQDTLNFKDHVRRIHKESNSTEYLRCEKCKYKTFNKQLLDLHFFLWHSLISNNNIKKYKCKRCNYKTVAAECYRRHLRYRCPKPAGEDSTVYQRELAVIKKGIDEANHQEQTDLTLVKLHVFQCVECSYNNEDSLNFKNHVRKVHKKSNLTEYLQCEQCQYKTLNKQLLDLHVLISHCDVSNIKKYECKLCNYQTVDSECYRRHLKNRCPESTVEDGTVCQRELPGIKKEIEEPSDLIPAKLHVFQCVECSYSNEDSYNFKHHVRKIHKKSNLTEYLRCGQCHYKTLNKQLLDVHVLLSHSDVSNVKKYECKLCNYKTVDLECYSRHLKNNRCPGSTAEDGVVYKCELAEIKKEIDEANSQEQTDLTLGKLYVFQCGECSYNNEDSFKFKNHIRKVHKKSNLTEYLQCEQCQYKTLNKQLLDLHVLLSHSDVSNLKKYECKSCNYQTVDSEYYSKHLKKKTCSGSTVKERTGYKCELCSYQATGKFYLKRHQLAHKKHQQLKMPLRTNATFAATNRPESCISSATGGCTSHTESFTNVNSATTRL